MTFFMCNAQATATSRKPNDYSCAAKEKRKELAFFDTNAKASPSTANDLFIA